MCTPIIHRAVYSGIIWSDSERGRPQSEGIEENGLQTGLNDDLKNGHSL